MDYTLCLLASLCCVVFVTGLPQYGNEHHQQPELEYHQHQPQHEVHEQQSQHEHIQPKNVHIPILSHKSETYKGGYQFHYKTGNGIYAEETGYLKKVPTDKDHHDKHSEHEEEAIVMQGKISYTGADGKPYTLTYIADEHGFQPQGDHLPTPPPAPHADSHHHQQLDNHHQVEGHHQQLEAHQLAHAGHETNVGHGAELQKTAQEYDEGYGHYGYH